MKIGIATNCFYPRRTTEEAFIAVGSLGAQTVGIGLHTFYEYRPEFAKKYAPSLGGLGVGAVTAEPCNYERQLFEPSRRIRGDGLYWLDQTIRSCQTFGAGYYVLRGIGGGESQFNVDETVEYIERIYGICAQYGVKLCIGNAFDGVFYKPGIFGEIRKKLTYLSAAFDLAQARRSGYLYPMYLKDASGSIACAYLSDLNDNGKQCLPGEGKTDFSEVFKRLMGEGFDGDVFVSSEGYQSEEAIGRSLQFLRETADKLK